jgi:nicotinate-nucleotide adenylyltransferase
MTPMSVTMPARRSTEPASPAPAPVKRARKAPAAEPAKAAPAKVPAAKTPTVARRTPAAGMTAPTLPRTASPRSANAARTAVSRATANRALANARPTKAPTPTASARRRAARRVGIMGGTFDPIHHGHLVAASEVASRFLLDEVVFVPTGQPWQKADYQVSTAEDRYLMTVIATASNPRFQVSRVDIDRPGPTFTVDTLKEIQSTYGPKVDLFFITGADALDKILSWKEPNQLFGLAHFVGVTRPGFELSDAHLPDATVSLVQVPAMAISSTDCRARVAAGLPLWYLVPDGVVQYIAKRHLYR